jgi:hypothetical protein
MLVADPGLIHYGGHHKPQPKSGLPGTGEFILAMLGSAMLKLKA